MRGGGPQQVLNLNTGQNSETICANADECMCVLRVRYNISTADYNSVGAYTGAAQFTDSSVNCPSVNQGNQANVDDAATGQNQDESCYSTLANGGRPLYNRPYVQAFDGDNAKLSIALNTDQSGRTWCSSVGVRVFVTIECVTVSRLRHRPTRHARIMMNILRITH